MPPVAPPRISVIIPTRNRADLLKRSVLSVLAQTFTDLELIVVNDASTDHTADVLATITDPRLSVVHRTAGTGAGAARNAGVAQATGDFISFQDDDDYWLIQKLERQIQLFDERPDVQWNLACFVRLTGTGVQYIGDEPRFSTLDFRRGIYDGGPDWSLISTPSWLIRRSFLDDVGHFDERVRSFDDWELALRMWRRERPVIVNEPLWVQDWRIGGGLIHATLKRANDLRMIMEKHADLWADQRTTQARMRYYIGRIESEHLPAPAGRKEIVRSLRLNPFRLKAWWGLGLSFLGQERALAIGMKTRRVINKLSGRPAPVAREK